MKNIILFLTLFSTVPVHAQLASIFTDKDACNLTSLNNKIALVDIATEEDLYSCNFAACQSATNTYMFENTAARDLYCQTQTAKSDGFKTSDNSVFKCDPIINTSQYIIHKYTPIPIDPNFITRAQRCAAIKECWADTASPRQAAWAEWKMGSLYCDVNLETKTNEVKP
jgi:hypothetical protein